MTVTFVDVLTAAWTALSSPSLTDADGRTRLNVCARCAETRRVVPATSAVSKNFTAWETWARPDEPGVCEVCVWGYRTPELRSSYLEITRSPSVRDLTPASLAVRLNQTLSDETALIIPLRRGRKHILPTAKWGRVNTDDIAVRWTASDAARLATVIRLRRIGIPSFAFTEPAPPFSFLSRLHGSLWQQVLVDWDDLAPWRRHPPWLQIALIAAADERTTSR